MKKYLLILFLLSSSPLWSQDKMLTLEDAVLKGNTTLAPRNLQGLQWRSANAYTYIRRNALVQGEVGKKESRELFRLKDFNAALKAVKLDTIPNLPNPTWLKNGDAIITYGNYLFINPHLDITDKDSGDWEIVNTWTKEAENSDVHYESNNAVYNRKFNMYLSLKDGKMMQFTFDGTKDVLYGKSPYAGELGIKKGTFWSPNGDLVAFYKVDQTNVTDVPGTNVDGKSYREKDIKYPAPGGKRAEVSIGIYNVTKETTVYLNTSDAKDGYLANVTWSPDQKYIYVQVVNRAQNSMKFNRYDAATGKLVNTLFEEKDAKFVEPLHPLIFSAKNPGDFYYMTISPKDGWVNISKYGDDGTLAARITKGNWSVTEILGMDDKESTIYFLGTKNSPIGIGIFSTDLAEHKIVNKISKAKGSHNALISPGGKYILDMFSSTTAPREIDVLDMKGEIVETLVDAVNPLKEYKTGATTLVTVPAEDGSMLNARMITPPGFDPSKKYPSITIVNNAPRSLSVTNSWIAGTDLWMQYMAQQGYIIFSLDGRGTINRGQAFEQATFHQLGTIEMQDQILGNKYLRGQTFIDGNKMGICGMGFGGFMTATLLTKSPDAYKAGVACMPVIDWKNNEAIYSERYMGMPDENKDAYAKSNPANFVKGMKGKLLLIDNANSTQAPVLTKKAAEEGKTIDNFDSAGKSRLDIMKKISDYFKENL